MLLLIEVGTGRWRIKIPVMVSGEPPSQPAANSLSSLYGGPSLCLEARWGNRSIGKQFGGVIL